MTASDRNLVDSAGEHVVAMAVTSNLFRGVRTFDVERYGRYEEPAMNQQPTQGRWIGSDELEKSCYTRIFSSYVQQTASKV